MCSGISETEAFIESTYEVWSGWITKAVLGGPTYLNDAQAARAMIEAGELESKEHDLESQGSSATGCHG